jgi:ABC-type oligopeptide transport system substrate-binding subunit
VAAFVFAAAAAEAVIVADDLRFAGSYWWCDPITAADIKYSWSRFLTNPKAIYAFLLYNQARQMLLKDAPLVPLYQLVRPCRQFCKSVKRTHL